MKRVFLFAVLGLLIVLVAWMTFLDRQVVREFQIRRWSEPARVYAEPLELYAGLGLSQSAVEQELRRLGYRRVERPDAAGTYSRTGTRLWLHARPVRFYDEARAARTVAISFGNTAIASIQDAAGKSLGAFRLDPLPIGSVFPEHGGDRIVLAPNEIPPILPAALKVVEDRDYDSHIGVDFTAIARALLANLRAGAIEQGASTITQQLVRSYFLDNRQTLWRKLREALMAVLLDAHFPKRDIMTAYVNEVYLGQDGQRAIHGFGLASQFYFGKSIDELDLEQAALLIALVRGPSYYEPHRHPDRALARRNLVLQLMGEFKVVAPDAAAAARRRPLGLMSGSGPRPGYYPAFLDLVRRTLRRDYRDQDLTQTGLRVFTTLDPRVQAQAEQSLADEIARLDRITHTREGTQAQPGGLEGVVIVSAPQSGDVIALVGGRQAGLEGFNRALDARRPIGSLVKPAIYLTALQSGRYTPATIVDDSPITVRLPEGRTWTPQNFTPETHGPVPMVRALAHSMNLATVHIGLDVGLSNIAATLEALGLSERPQPVPAMLLGAVNAAPIEVAQIYDTLANGGFRTPLRAVRAVVDPRGNRLRATELEAKSVADPLATYELDRMLVEVVNRGTAAAARARLPKALIVAGKTGTSSDYRDSWFAGFSGSHLVVAWIGRDDNAPTNLTGSSGALVVWTSLMSVLQTSAWDPPLPDALEERWIDWQSGYLADPECSADVVVVALPQGADVPVQPGCGTLMQDLSTRVREWLREVLR
ncbi:MAG: penicillin-binding protein 1B [Steroidobacteraceae bacterium]